MSVVASESILSCVFFWKLDSQGTLLKYKIYPRKAWDETFEGNGFINDIDCGHGFHGYIHISKLINLCTLNMYSILYDNHTSIKWFKKYKI